MLHIAAGTSLLCFPFICNAGQVEEARAGNSNLAAAQISDDTKTPAPTFSAQPPAPQEAATQVHDAIESQAAPEQAPKVRNYAVTAAVADGVTTKLALSAGALESNPVAASLPLVVLTGAKIALAMYAETLPEKEKRLVIKTSSSVWGGAAVNNVLLLMATPPPFPIVAGILMGVLVWKKTAREYDDHDRKMAALQAAKLASAPVPASVEPVTLVVAP
jgi:hypothetical protein